MSEITNYYWREVSPGQYERDIDEAEWYYTSLAKAWARTGHSYFAITACTGFSISSTHGAAPLITSEIIEKAFRHAWTRLRYHHPSIAAPVEYKPSVKRYIKTYRSPSSHRDVEAWLQETLKTIDNGMSGADFANTDPDVGRCATLYLITHPASREDFLRRDILFRCSHDMMDGIGTLQLLDRLLQYVSDALVAVSPLPPIAFGAEAQNLSPPLRLAANIPTHPSLNQLEEHHRKQDANATARSHPNVLSIPFNARLKTPLRSQRISSHFTEEETSSILAKCKALGVTITHVVHASIALVMRDLQPRSLQQDLAHREGRYISHGLVNLRRMCKDPYNTPQHATGVYQSIISETLALDLKIPNEERQWNDKEKDKEEKEEFECVLKTVKDFYLGFKADADYMAIVPELFRPKSFWPGPDYLAKSGDEPAPCPIPPPKTAPTVSLSSLGILDKIVQPIRGAFHVGEPWVMGAEYSTGLGVFLSTWKGNLVLSAGFNEAFHRQAEVDMFLAMLEMKVLRFLETEGDANN